MIEDKNLKQIAAWVFILGIFVLAFLILKPIIISIVFGLLFGYIFRPVYLKIKSFLRGGNVSAFVLMAGMAILLILPLIYLVPPLVKQLAQTYAMFQNFNFNAFFQRFVEPSVAVNLARNLDNVIGRLFSTILNQFTAFVSQRLATSLLQMAVFLFTFYFVIKDMDKIKEYVLALSPFSRSTERKFLEEFRGITTAIILGQVLIGVIQGLAVGLGLFFLGIPNALTLTFIATIVSVIPVIGAWLVWFPIGVFLLLSGQIFQGIFLLLYGVFFVSMIDNFLRPYFLSRGSNLPLALSIIGTIGGLFFFGVAGLILGPLILAYVLIVLEFYKQGKLNELFKNQGI